MRASDISFPLTTVFLAGVAACDYTQDTVAPSCYSEMAQAGRSSVSTAATASPPPASTSRPAAPSGGQSSTGGAPAPSTTPTSSSSTLPSTTATAGSSSQTPATTGTTAPSTGSGGGCDLTGRWLQTIHKVTDGLGNLQTSHNYFYYEIEQQGDALSVKRSLLCGTQTVGGGSFAVTVDFSGAQAGVMKNVSHDGRKGSSVKAANGCKVSLDKQYMVFGATLPHYLDPQTTLPSAEEKAAGSTPGWEDWDNDGNPGITGVCSGTVTGKIFTAPREWVTLSGTVPDVGSVFKLSMTWDQEPNVMSFDGSPFLGATAVRAADASLHFAQFARLKSDQATGDDAAICKSVVALAPLLTPEAAGM